MVSNRPAARWEEERASEHLRKNLSLTLSLLNASCCSQSRPKRIHLHTFYN